MSILKRRIQEFEEVLGAKEIEEWQLRRLCFNGIPDEGSLRPLCWKLLLNYIPSSSDKWDETLARKRELYKSFIDDLIVIPGESNSDTDGRIDVTSDDHPLNLDPDSKWQAYFKDNEVLLQIDKDVRRLCPDISFFQQGTEYPCEAIVHSNGQKRLHQRVHHTVLKSASVERKGLGVTKIAVSARKAIEDYAPLEGGEAHWEVLERILFLYAKLNPGQGYVQGMNEIVGPIYYAFACDPDQKWREHAEADTFFCFTNLMAEIRDFFIKSLDEAEFGINAMMDKLISEVKSNCYDIWLRLHQQELCPQYYSFRWLTLLLSQEFPLPDVMRIWDSLFSDDNRFDFLIHICCAMILLCKNQILNGDFAANVKLLQNFPSMDIQIVLTKAAELAEKASC
ncbi:TBC1 domain family member 13 [Copidosoma floridanum]|uniref:TBC1 domain family member 13 n=1 Tax=Copidosoma floridanum TaxID=29053 RepID=UPI0006C98BEF|nr:TBC1 domain family member 13 [Copidosoma floridanum]XP_014208111.1 TBC1 domain family member 13 [Copidosoma floridanum]XP_014208112.1 TBC1 domain family member 13 [Copidosoma floridanum]